MLDFGIDYVSACSSVGIMICECVFFGSSCLESSIISFLLNHFHKLDSKFEHQMEKNKWGTDNKTREKNRASKKFESRRLYRKTFKPIDFLSIYHVWMDMYI